MDGWTDLSTLLRRYGLDAIYAFESRATEVGACVRGEGVFESHEQGSVPSFVEKEKRRNLLLTKQIAQRGEGGIRREEGYHD